MPFGKIFSFSLLLAVWASAVPVVISQPQTVFIRRFTDEEGLPNNQYRVTIQDQNGLLWMGGSDGLAKYDGYNFTTFRHKSTDTTTISNNNVSALFEDSRGRLWVGTLGGGINLSDATKTSFSIPVIHQDGSVLQNDQIMSDICEDALGRFWVVCHEELLILEEKNGIFEAKSLEDIVQVQGQCSPVQLYPTAVRAENPERVWIGTAAGLYLVNIRAKTLTCPESLMGLPIREVHFIEKDRKGRWWVATDGPGARLYYTDPESLVFRSFSGVPFQSDKTGLQIVFDLDNRIWATEFNVQFYGYDLADSTLFLESSKNSTVPIERFMRNPFVDGSGDVWIHGPGYLVYPYPKGFQNYIHPYTFHQSNSAIYSVGDELWLAYREEGIVRLNMKTGKAKHFSESRRDAYIPVNHIVDIRRVSSGNTILVGFSLVAVMDKHDKIIAQHIISGTNRAVFEDSKGNIWIGGFSGLHLFSETEGVLKSYKLPRNIGDDRNFIQDIVEDENGYIWFASDLNGLGRLDPETEEIIQFLPVRGDPGSLPSSSIDAIALDSNNTLWIASDVALVRMNTGTFEMEAYDISNGFNNDYFSAIVCDDQGMIWVSTHAGISSFDPVTLEVKNYTQNDGLLNRSYYSRSSYYSDNGIIYFGGGSGIDYLRPGLLRKNPTAPIMHLEDVLIDNKNFIQSMDSVCKGGLEITYRNDLLQIEFTGLYYTAQQSVNYYYRMDGLRDEWTDIGHNHSAVFTDLKPGEYAFRAKAVSPDGVWSEELLLPVTVTPPFFETLWFRIVAACLLGGILFGVIKYRERGIERKERREAEISRKMSELEKRALQAQMNPHFIYNCMNSIQQFMVVHDFEGAMKYLTRFSRILRAVLNMSSLNRVALSDEIKLIEDYLELENMRFPNKFSYEINVSSELNVHTVEIPPFFIQPQVENAVRHGLLKKEDQGVLYVNIDKDGKYVKISVEDNGIGREASMAARAGEYRESKGLSIVKERLSHLHQTNGIHPFVVTDLYDEARNPSGTKVEVYLPLES